MLNKKKIRCFIKNLQRGRYKKKIQRISMGAAVCCAALLAVYYIQGEKAETEIDNLRQIKEKAETVELEGLVSSQPPGTQIMAQYQELFYQNSDFIGWLTIDGTKVDYPVMWTPQDMEYYSQKGFDGEDSKNGLLFLDSGSNIKEYGGNLIVYGHNMKNGSMFADLLNYKKENYYEEHKIIQFDTLYETRKYEITAVAAGSGLDQFSYGFTNADQESAETAINNMKTNALYETGVGMKFGDDFLTLSTCDYSWENGRLVVMARRVQ